MKQGRIKWLRRRIRFARWRRRLFSKREELDRMQQTGEKIVLEHVKDRSTSMEHCPVTMRRVLRRGNDTIVMQHSTVSFIGDSYYYTLAFPARVYDDMLRSFDDELAKKMANDYRRMLRDVNAGLGSIIAEAKANIEV